MACCVVIKERKGPAQIIRGLGPLSIREVTMGLVVVLEEEEEDNHS